MAGGGYCQWLYKALRSLDNKITCIIDNNSAVNEINQIPVVNINHWLLKYEKTTEAVILTSWNYHEAFNNELDLIEFQGDIIDIPEWILGKFPDFTRPIYEYHYSRMNYIQINEMELLYRKAKGTEKYSILKRIIYALLWIKDFLYAEKYIVEMERNYSEFGESENYRCAINKIKEIMLSCVKQQGNKVLFIHIVDSLADDIIEDMRWLNAHSKEGIRFRGVTVQIPGTHFAMNTMFTGKSVFDIETTTENIDWSDSELLSYLKEEGYSVNLASGVKHIRQEFEKINRNAGTEYTYFTLTEALFEGLVLWEKQNNKNIIILHSCGEIHSSFLRIGGGKRLVLCKDMTKRAQFEQQFAEAVQYADEELEWYDFFYNMTNMPMIIMGDHGVSCREQINHFMGCKKDMVPCVKETITPALIINRMGVEYKEINGIVPNTKIPQIIKSVLEREIACSEEVCADVAELQFVPGYNESYCINFMRRGIWGKYEGFVGIRTLHEMYLVSASGKEIYFRPDECGYRNLADNSMYINELRKIQKIFEGLVFPIGIYGLEKYKKHMELLKIYDNDSYQKIAALLNKSDK